MVERVLFVEPARSYSVNSEGEFTLKPRKNVSYPGLTILGSLKSAGFEIEFMDLHADGFYNKTSINDSLQRIGLPDEAILDRISNYDPSALLLSSTFSTGEQMVDDLATKVKGYFPNLPIIVGGIHATSQPNWVLESGSVDFVVLGEGENTILELLKGLSMDDIDLVNGIAYKKNGRVTTLPSSRLINLNRPWALEEILLNGEEYHYDDKSSRRSDLYAHLTKPDWTRDFSLVYSRGCPTRCDFCLASEKDGVSVRHVGHERMFDDFRLLHEVYGVNIFYNQADTFGLHEEDIEFLRKVREYSEEHPDFVLNNPNSFFARLFFPKSKNYELDVDFLDLLSESSFNIITLSIETWNRRFNKKVNLDEITPQKISDLGYEIHRRGMKTELYMMYAFPEQTEEEFAYDRSCVDSIQNIDSVSWHSCMIFPGTTYFQRGLREGWFTEKSYREILRNTGLSFNNLPNELNFSEINQHFPE